MKIKKEWVQECRKLSRSIGVEVLKKTHPYSTISIERTILRLIGVHGSLRSGNLEIPLVNVMVDDLLESGLIENGILSVLCEILDSKKITFEQLNRDLLSRKYTFLNLTKSLSNFNSRNNKIRTKRLSDSFVKSGIKKIDEAKKLRKKIKSKVMDPEITYKNKRPLMYVIVATGDIYEDLIQAESAATLGADIIAVIRSTAQSLLDYVPEGATRVGFGGTYATQENFRLMREKLDEVGKKVGKYIRLTNYSSGLCMAEIAALAALEGLDCLLNDAMYGILFRDINMMRTLVDQHFSRRICARADIQIQTGEDNYLTTDDAIENGHTVLTSQFINESLANRAKIKPNRLALGHAMEMDPWDSGVLLKEIARAQMTRDIFPKSPLKYMPPTKHMEGDIFFGQSYNTIFNLVGTLTNQGVQLLGMPTEAIHTPFLQDRWTSIKNANYVFGSSRELHQEILIKPGSRIEKFANEVLRKSLKQLKKIEREGLFKSIENKAFANISRKPDGGKGYQGVFKKNKNYLNPFMDLL